MPSESYIHQEAGRKWILPHMFFFGGIGEGHYMNCNCFYGVDKFREVKEGEWYVVKERDETGRYEPEYRVERATGYVGKALVIYPTVRPPSYCNVEMLGPKIIERMK